MTAEYDSLASHGHVTWAQVPMCLYQLDVKEVHHSTDHNIAPISDK